MAASSRLTAARTRSILRTASATRRRARSTGARRRTRPPAVPGLPANLPYAPCGYVPWQLRSVYGVDQAVAQGVKGQGVTVAIIDAFASPTLFADARQYSVTTTPPTRSSGRSSTSCCSPRTPTSSPPTSATRPAGTASRRLDVEAVHAMAPGAAHPLRRRRRLPGRLARQGPQRVVARHLADIVSQLLRRPRRGRPRRRGRALPPDRVQRRDGGHRPVLLVRRRRRRERRPRPPVAPTSPPPTRGSPRSAAPASASAATAARSSRPAGRPPRAALDRRRLRPGARAPSSTARAVAPAGSSPSPGTRGASCPTRWRSRTRPATDRRAASCPTSRWSATRTPACSIGQTQTFPEGAYYDQYRIGGTSLSCPLMAGIMALADNLLGTAARLHQPVAVPPRRQPARSTT